MTRLLPLVLSVILAILAATGHGSTLRAQTVIPLFPSSAVIRGENIRLRAEPAEQSANLLIMQRGDEVTITGEVTLADGLEFYPVEYDQTGDAGWVRTLFIDPGSIVPIDGAIAPAVVPDAEPEPEPEPDRGNRPNRQADEPAADDAGEARRERPARDQRQNRDQNQDAAADDAVADDAVADDAVVDVPADDAPADDAPADDPPAAGTVASVSGVGPVVSEPFTLEPDRYQVTASMEVSAPTGFTCEITGPEDFTETLFSEIIDAAGPWTAEASLRIRDGGEFVVECVDTEEAWTLDFAPA